MMQIATALFTHLHPVRRDSTLLWSMCSRYAYQRIIRPSRPIFHYRDFASYCKLLREEPQQPVNRELTQLTQVESSTLKAFLQEHKVRGEIRNILTGFEFLDESIIAKLTSEGITEPSAIQKIAIPTILEGHDLISVAQTGSGKTLAFVLPGMIHLQAQPQTEGPRILVLAPTRELAKQIETQYRLFAKTICLYGGSNKQEQQRRLSIRPQIVIATPGRLLDLMNDGFSLNTITQVVLDEADRMLDMGFEEQIRDVLSKVREDRQTLFFSATWPIEVRNLADSLCRHDPALIQIGDSLNKNIEQSLIVTGHEKFGKFMDLLNECKDQKMLIFCQRKMDTEKLEFRLAEEGIKARHLHGDLSQGERDRIMSDFRNGHLNVLIATNLASRGLDVKDVDLVINYDFPESIEDYIHRIGRTGRAGRVGRAVSFVQPQYMNFKLKQQVVDMFNKAKQPLPKEFLRRV